MIDKVKDLKSTNGRFEGELTEEGARDLMAFGRRPPGGGPAPTIKGTLRFWVKAGELTKYEIATDITMNTPMGEMTMSPVTTVRLKEVGTTKFEVPAAAKMKLEGK